MIISPAATKETLAVSPAPATQPVSHSNSVSNTYFIISRRTYPYPYPYPYPSSKANHAVSVVPHWSSDCLIDSRLITPLKYLETP